MVEKYKLNEDAFKEFKNVSEEDIQYLKRKLSIIISEFNNFGIPVHLHNSHSFLWCYRGLENMKCFNEEYPDFEDIPIDRGFGVTFKSIAKYLKNNYVNDLEKYFITCYRTSTDYEKPWKLGSYINLDGENTEDFICPIEDKKKADEIDYFICFNVFHLIEK